MADDGTGSDYQGKIVLTAIVLVLAIPGLVIEPGPVSELTALAFLASIWLTGDDPAEAASDAA